MDFISSESSYLMSLWGFEFSLVLLWGFIRLAYGLLALLIPYISFNSPPRCSYHCTFFGSNPTHRDVQETNKARRNALVSNVAFPQRNYFRDLISFSIGGRFSLGLYGAKRVRSAVLVSVFPERTDYGRKLCRNNTQVTIINTSKLNSRFYLVNQRFHDASR